jgi:hypothetical protein
MPQTVSIPDVKPVTVEGYHLSVDGEMIVLTVKDRAGNVGRIGLDWHDLPNALGVINKAAMAAKTVRTKLGKSDTIIEKETKKFFIVTGYEVGDQGVFKLLALHIANGLRFDFALSRDAPDPGGADVSLPEAVGALLTGRTLRRRSRTH